MSTRTLPVSTPSLYTLVALLYAELASTIQVHGVRLPSGWKPEDGNSVVVANSGGPGSLNGTELDERFMIHSYGQTDAGGLDTDIAVFNALHRWEGQQVIVDGEIIYIGLIAREAGPYWNREPITEWARQTSTYRVVMSEWAKP